MVRFEVLITNAKIVMSIIRPDKVNYLIVRHFYSKIDFEAFPPPLFFPYKKVKISSPKIHSELLYIVFVSFFLN